MKICLVQSASRRGEVAANIRDHLVLVRAAVRHKVDLIVFPELSVTGYEPTLAEELVSGKDDPRLNDFQAIADAEDVIISLGLPVRSPDGITISMVFLRPQAGRLSYAKRLLHADELPFFVRGQNPTFLLDWGERIAFGICYEALRREHYAAAIGEGASVYVASVAKSAAGCQKARREFPEIAREFGLPVLMVNSVGYCDNFLSSGNSAVWDERGALLTQLNEQEQGLLLYDTASGQASTFCHLTNNDGNKT